MDRAAPSCERQLIGFLGFFAWYSVSGITVDDPLLVDLKSIDLAYNRVA